MVCWTKLLLILLRMEAEGGLFLVPYMIHEESHFKLFYFFSPSDALLGFYELIRMGKKKACFKVRE